MTTDILVLVSDFMPIYELGLAEALNRVDGLTAAAATSQIVDLGLEAVRQRASVVIVGLADSVDDIAALAADLSNVRPSVHVLVAVDPDDGTRIGDLMGLGSINLLSRRATLVEVGDAVRAVAAGRTIVPADIAPRMMDELSVAVRRAEARWHAGGLTRRELEVLNHVADGLPNRDVARILHISENTVKNHMRNIHEKLGVKTRTEAVVKAAKEGLLGSRFSRLSRLGGDGELSGSGSS